MRSRRLRQIVFLWVCAVGFPVVGFWLGWRWCEGKNYVKDNESLCRFAQIRDMLLAYHEQHGSFPATRYQPEAGGPVHS